jgi:hypothetical protein
MPFCQIHILQILFCFQVVYAIKVLFIIPQHHCNFVQSAKQFPYKVWFVQGVLVRRVEPTADANRVLKEVQWPFIASKACST